MKSYHHFPTNKNNDLLQALKTFIPKLFGTMNHNLVLDYEEN